LHTDELTRALYSTDASLFQVQPLGVAVPCDLDDVQTLVRYAAEHRLALTPRGAGTGFAGEALNGGIIVDLSAHFRGLGPLVGDSIFVEAGVVLDTLNAALAPHGRRFAPDPASSASCTLGGMLATNASGARSVRHGYTRDHVERLQVVWDNGDAANVGSEPLVATDEEPTRTQSLVYATAGLLDAHRELITAYQPRTPYNRCAYRLDDVLGPDTLDLQRLLVGSEGTLALFTGATLKTVPLPTGRSAVLFGFASMDAALRAAQLAHHPGLTACDLLDRRLAALVRGHEPDSGRLIPASAEAVLLVEYEADSPNDARGLALELIDRLHRTERLAVLAEPATSDADINRLWRLRDAALPGLYNLAGGARAVPLIEDVAVPIEALPTYLHRVQDILQHYETTASFLVHAVTGQVHARPLLNLHDPAQAQRLWALAEAVHGCALDLGGTVSTQHGTGIARTPWVERQYGPLLPVFRSLKAIFDPNDRFNPGKIVGPLPADPIRLLRKPVLPTALPMLTDETDPPPTPELRWQPDELARQVAQCNGCGDCRPVEPPLRSCPIFRVLPSEAATPRGKANLVRQVLQTDPRQLGSEDVRAVANLCVNCKMCARECPARVNIPKLMLEAKAAHQREHGLSRSDWVLARTESFAALGSLLALVVNPLLAQRPVRWLLEKLFGVSAQRRLPAFAVGHFLRRARRRGWTKPIPAERGLRFAYFVDVFANYNDPSIGEATVAVLRHHGLEVYVPPGQIGCGMAPLAQGDVETAREVVRHNLRIFADLARVGYRIVCSEPTAALMLRFDQLDLLDDPDAELVAGATVELTTLLGDLHAAGRLRTDFQPLPLSVGHHTPCHLKALNGPVAGPDLLRLIPGLRVTAVDVSCSGMAGTFGLKAENYAHSLAAGQPMLDVLRRPGILTAATECSACRLQIEEGTGKRTLHPVQYLALAYGLLPELAGRLQRPLRGLVDSWR
jgi:FAD/FMN-containing dehydrogenase/Fe-S oxidoreductase